MFTNKQKVHIIGIGGIGTSGIAQLLLAYGLRVSGSDLKASGLTRKLKGLGAEIFIGHDAANVKDQDLVIYSAAVKPDNPELAQARARGITILTRAQALAELANQKDALAVTGAHGKTTTSSLIAHLLIQSGLQPTICVGGELLSLDGNAFLGRDQYFVLEADESDGSFLDLKPLYSVITNIDREHLDYYRDLEQIIETFRQFIVNTREEGCVFFCQDDAHLRQLLPRLHKRMVSFGFSAGADFSARDLICHNNISRFNCLYQGSVLGEIVLQIPGTHNISNALAVIAVGVELGLEFKTIQAALSSFKGVRRRQELRASRKGVLIFEDYAHHPTEIKATLDALKGFRHKRLLAVFQPHRYTRTKFLLDEFGRCFQGVDQLIITDIYPASEAPIAGVEAKNICQKAVQDTDIQDVRFLAFADILPHLLQELRAGDLVAILGAGDIGSIADALAEKFKGAGTL